MNKLLLFTITSLLAVSAWGQSALHVAVDGSDTAAGTADAPFATIQRAVDAVQPGGTIYIHGGTYFPAQRIKIPAKATSASAPIRMWAYGDGDVTIDGSKMQPKSLMEFKMARCLYLPYDACHWHFKGLTFCHAKDNGAKVEGSYNTFEHCTFRDNNDSGLQIGMFKDWSIEETKSFPVKGTPEFNPGYTYCRGNKVINCDSYNNYDAVSFTGTDDGGDADGFACKLFPGPGTEFHGCRAWNNSDDNWDLYMVYHPVVIDGCYAFNAGLDASGATTPGNGNGFKLGGGGSSGGAAFDQSVGAHVVTNCVAFNNTRKGFDQNNAYEGIYLFNCTAWGNEYNYRFPTMFKYGGMVIRNCVGFNAKTLNHEFLSAGKEGYQLPDTEHNSWTTIDGCDPVKDGNKVNGTKRLAADHSAQFVSLLEADAKAPRQPDGSLPDNNFSRLVAGSRFIDAGTPIQNYEPARFMTAAEASAAGIELVAAPAVSIDFNGASADMGAFESGTPTVARLSITGGPAEQTIYTGTQIAPVTLRWSGAATDVTLAGLSTLTAEKQPEQKSVTVSGSLTESTQVTVTTVGGATPASVTLTFTVSHTAPATLECISANATQTVWFNSPISPIIYECGGGATAISVSGLADGLTTSIDGRRLTISGTPRTECSYTVTATGGLSPVTLGGSISLEIPSRVLTGDWYHIQDPITALPTDLQGIVSIENGSSYTTEWNPAYVESSGTAPAGCTVGAVNIERDGALVWTLPSLLELKANVHFTGGRTLTVKWQREGEAEQTWNSGALKKATLTGWDLMQMAGIDPTPAPITVKFVNDGAKNNGGIRVYDFYAKVYASSALPAVLPTEAVEITRTPSTLTVNLPAHTLELFTPSGHLIARTTGSTLTLPSATHGIHILRVRTANGIRVLKISL